MRTLLATLLATALPLAAVADEPATRHFALVNRSLDSVTAIAVATPGGADFRTVALATPLTGGGSTMSLAIVAQTGACRHDLRVTFRHGRTALVPNVDLCGRPRVALERGAAASRGAVIERVADARSAGDALVATH